jgi:hypothetical protein
VSSNQQLHSEVLFGKAQLYELDPSVLSTVVARIALIATPSITTAIAPLETSVAIASAPSIDVVVTAAWIPETPRRDRCRCLPLSTHATRNALIES